MARGTYVETPALRSLRTLVGFAEGDKPAPALAAVAQLDRLTSESIKAFRRLTAAEVEQLRADLRVYLRVLAGGKEARLGDAITPTLFPLRVGTKVQILVGGSPKDVTLYTAVSLLQEVGMKQLCLCPAPDCGRAFVKIGRRKYCSTRCQRRVFLSSYDPFAASPRRKDKPDWYMKGTRHGKTTRTR